MKAAVIEYKPEPADSEASVGIKAANIRLETFSAPLGSMGCVKKKRLKKKKRATSADVEEVGVQDSGSDD